MRFYQRWKKCSYNSQKTWRDKAENTTNLFINKSYIFQGYEPDVYQSKCDELEQCSDVNVFHFHLSFSRNKLINKWTRIKAVLF